MPVYDFSLVLDSDPEPHKAELLAAGCDDADFGRQNALNRAEDYFYADFRRTAPSYEAARDSAVQAVESVGLGVIAIVDDL